MGFFSKLRKGLRLFVVIGNALARLTGLKKGTVAGKAIDAATEVDSQLPEADSQAPSETER